LDDFVRVQREKVSLDYRRVDSLTVHFDLVLSDGGWVSRKIQSEAVGVVECGLNQVAGCGLSSSEWMTWKLCFVFVNG